MGSSELKIVVFGANGRTGRQVVATALEHGHDVRAFVRDPAKLAGIDARVQLRQGDVTNDPDAVVDAVAGQDAVIVTLGPRSPRDRSLLTRSVRNIIPAMERHTVERLIVLSALGLGGTGEGAPLMLRLAAGTLMRNAAIDKRTSEEMIRASTLSWTIACPGQLTNRPATGRYRAGEDLHLAGLPRISRADVAGFLVTEAEHPTFVRRIAILGC